MKTCLHSSQIVSVLILSLSALSLTLSAAQSAQAPKARLKVKVSPDQAKMFSTQNSRLIADYGSFQLWDVPAGVREDVRRAGGEVREKEDVIELNAKPIQTALGMAQAAAPSSAAFTGKRLHLVQFAGPIKPEWRQQLVDQGWQVVSYIPRNAYLVYGNTNSLNGLRSALPTATHIQWEGEYKSEHKIHPAAQSLIRKASAGQESHDMFAIQLVEDPEANSVTLQLFESRKRGDIQQTRALGYVNCILRIPPSQLAAVAERPDVVSIQPYQTPQKFDERQDQILAGNLSGNGPSGPGYLSWLDSRGFNQSQFTTSGFAVDISDSGIDNGTQMPGHFGLYTSGNTALASRVKYNRFVGTTHTGATLQGIDGHGNINAHIVGAYNDLNAFPHLDTSSYHYGLGICPFVRLGSSVIFDNSNPINDFTSPSYAEIQSRAYNDGARISCNSWGADLQGAYSIDSQKYDALVRDAQPTGSPYPIPGNQEMVIVFSAGNAGIGGSGTIGAPGSAKNVLCVGASENVHSDSDTNGGNDPAGNDGCLVDDTLADSANDIASFSSLGPCQDTRIKPDLVAPGTHVSGGVGQTFWDPFGLALPGFNAFGVCALPGGGTRNNLNNFFPLAQPGQPGQQFYTISSGTSHACPAVGGGAALLRQFFINQGLTAPSPAMTKAWLMNSARYLTGAGANDNLPSDSQGMGSMNLGMAFDGIPRVVRDEVSADRFTATGQYRTFSGTIFDSTKPFRVTLAWTDAPGNTTGNAYNNDLDLQVMAGGNAYFGNVFSSANSVPGGAAVDHVNNVESVFIPAGVVSGSFTVTVIADNINSDGVPNNSDLLDQDFALVVYNGTLSGASGPPTPTGLSATVGVNFPGNPYVRLTWNASTGATGYRIKRSTVSGGPYLPVGSTSSTLYMNLPVANATIYYYVVSAFNSTGESANSSEITTTTPTLAAPTGFTATSCNGQVNLNWNTISAASGYRVKRSTTSGGPYTIIASPVAKPYSDVTVINGTTYYYVVSALNAGGESGNSTQVGTTPQPVSATITPFAGNHSLGGSYSGDGGPATSAGLCGPVGIHFFGGNLVIADSCNSAVRMVNSSGTMINVSAQVPRSILFSPYGVGLDRNGYIYVADGDWGAIREFQGDNDPIDLDTNMYVACIPDGIGNLYAIQGSGISSGYIVNQMHCVIPNFGSPDGIITTLATVNPSLSFYQNGRVVLSSLTVDSRGNIYVADLGSHSVFMIDTSGSVNTVAGTPGTGGYNGDNILAVNAELLYPAGVAVRGSYLYISDSGNSRIRQVDLTTGIITTVAGTGVAGYNGDNGPATSIQLNMPSGLCVDPSGNLYISDTANDVVRKLRFCP